MRRGGHATGHRRRRLELQVGREREGECLILLLSLSDNANEQFVRGTHNSFAAFEHGASSYKRLQACSQRRVINYPNVSEASA